jgi:phosphatidate cytidylyltransferase
MSKPSGPEAASKVAEASHATVAQTGSSSKTRSSSKTGSPPVAPGSGGVAGRVGADLWPRVASGLVLATIATAAVVGGVTPLAIILAIVGAIVSWEWGRMVRGNEVDAAMSAHIATVIAAIVLTASGLAGPSLLAVLIGTILTGVLSFGRHSMLSAVGVLFAALPGIALLWFRADKPLGMIAVFFVLAAVVATDVGAYFCGRLIGGPRLWPRVSPNKTWSGLGGGVTAAALISAAFANVVPLASPSHLALLGAGLALAAQAGDLAESALKRSFGTKDTSGLIPGHGGFMDRVDGLATASVAAAAVAAIINVSAPARALLTW